MATLGNLNFTPEQYREAAHKWRRDLIKLPLFALEETTKYMTVRPGIRYKESVGKIGADAQLRPWVQGNSKPGEDVALNLDFRTLETYLGYVIEKFDPNTIASTLLGMTGTTMGEGLKTIPTAKEAISLVVASVGEHLHDHIWDAVRNDSGTTTKDLFNGFDTITNNEIAGGGISKSVGNLTVFDSAIDSDNAVEALEDLWMHLPLKLKRQQLYLYCTQELVDMYNINYRNVHGQLNYNNKFENGYVNISGGKLAFVPLASKVGSPFLHISTKKNMLIGVDQMSNMEQVDVAVKDHFLLSLGMRMFFGTQFECIAPEIFHVVKLGEATFTITFKNGDTVVKTETLTAGAAITAPTAPDGYVWKDCPTYMPAANVVVEAVSA